MCIWLNVSGQHLHAEDSPVSTTSGHYVSAIRQNNEWHLANDEFVRRVRMNECPLLPCGILFEKCDDQCSPKTMLIEGTMCEELGWDQCICKEAESVPGAASTHKSDSADIMMPGETEESVHGTQPVLTGAVRTQAAETDVGRGSKAKKTAESAESAYGTQPVLTGAVRAQAAETDVRRGSKDKKRKTSDGTQAKTLLKYFKTAPNQDRSDRNQDRSDGNQDRSDRNQDRSCRQKPRSVSPKSRSVKIGQTETKIGQPKTKIGQPKIKIGQTETEMRLLLWKPNALWLLLGKEQRNITWIHSCWIKRLWLYLQKDTSSLCERGLTIVCVRFQTVQTICHRFHVCYMGVKNVFSPTYQSLLLIAMLSTKGTTPTVCACCICCRSKCGSFLAVCNEPRCRILLSSKLEEQQTGAISHLQCVISWVVGKVWSKMNDGVLVGLWHVWCVLKDAGQRNSFRRSLLVQTLHFRKKTRFVCCWIRTCTLQVGRRCHQKKYSNRVQLFTCKQVKRFKCFCTNVVCRNACV